MKIASLNINNYRIFRDFSLEDLAVPNNKDEGSGLNIILGENGLGKTSILDAVALGLNTYKTDYFSWHDLKDEGEKVEIKLSSVNDFEVKKLYRGDFQAEGFRFEGYLREQSSGSNNKIIVKNNLYVSDEVEDGKPDLRASLPSVYGSPRHKQDYEILDANYRLGAFTPGSKNKSSFDYFLEDLSYRYIKEVDDKNDLNATFKGELEKIDSSSVIGKAVSDFNEATGFNLDINLIENNELFSNSFLGHSTDHDRVVNVSKLGSGYPMFLALLISYHRSQNNNDDLIILIDEPEVHLHPELQKRVVKKLLEISKFAQIFITSHSPLLVHHLSESGNRYYNEILLEKNESGEVHQKEIDSRVLPNSTPAETNYLVFNRSSFEYHNELYGHLMYLSDQDSVKALDNSFDIGDEEKYDWQREDVEHTQRLSVHSVIRNSFHHKENSLNEYVDSSEFIKDNLQSSIEFLREAISNYET